MSDERTETISDMVRRTEVEIEGGRTTGGVASTAGRFAVQLRDRMEVVGSDGLHVGTLDHMDESRLKLKKVDPVAGGQHHYLAQFMVQSVAGFIVFSMTTAEARARWPAA